MNILIKNRSFSQIGFTTTLVSALFILIFALLIILNEYNTYRETVKSEEQAYLQHQKNLIRQETERALKFIHYKYAKYRGMPTEELKKTIVDAIEYMRNERDGTGYIFIYTYEGINIADPILKQNAGKNMLDFTDPEGTRVIADLIEVSKKPDGGYVEYVWNKPIINRLAPKISYAKSFEPWGWMVGSGVYLDTVHEEIVKKREQYQKKLLLFSLQVGIVGLIMLFLAVMFSQSIQNILKKEVSLFRHFFDKASRDYEPIRQEELNFLDFKELAGLANKMVEEIREKNEALTGINEQLEEKVKAKTLILKEKNDKLTKALQENAKLIKEQDIFIKNTIHEVNTPLAIILANIDLARMKSLSNRYMTNIESAAKVISNLYNDLSFYIKKDRMEFKKEPIDITRITRERLAFFDEVALGNELDFQSDIEADTVIDFNPTEFGRIIDNLLSNAIKYSYPNTRIAVSLKQEAQTARLEVANEGDAIKGLKDIFKRFYRENDNRGGFGIGLNMVYEICRKNGVPVSVTSEGGLNTFRFTFALRKKDSDENTSA